jgi:type II secretory pathway pseudopilin PulG
MRLSAPRRTTTILALVIITVLIILNLAIYAGLFTHQPTPDQSQLSLPGLPGQTVVILHSAITPSPNQAIQRLLPIIITIIVIASLAGILIGYMFVKQRQKRHRDHQRLRDLQTIAETFEQYFKQHGHYPVSATYDPQYYSAINILTEWSSYNFPSAEEMRHFNSQWPPCDPNFIPTSKDQSGNYLYYPHHFGQKFSLYAQLEAPTQHPIPSYNTIDQLSATFGQYNFRLNGPDHHQDTLHPTNQPSDPSPHEPHTPSLQ